MEDGTFALLKRRVYDLAGCMNSYGGKRVKVNNKLTKVVFPTARIILITGFFQWRNSQHQRFPVVSRTF